EAEDLPQILQQAVARGAERGIVPPSFEQSVYQELLKREQKLSTAIGHAVAVPHAYVEGVPEPSLILVRLARPVNMGAPDGIPTRYLFVLIGPPGQAGDHLDTLTQIARLMSDDGFRYDLGVARSAGDILQGVDAFQQRTQPVELRREAAVPAALQYSGRLGGGLLADLRRRRPHYVDDYVEGVHPKALTAILFMTFVCLAPAVTFGGLMFAASGESMGVTEMLVATAGCGIVFALLGGHPLIVLGGTGPLLVFTGTLYQLCADLHVPFLPTYAWVGLWTALLTVLLSVTDASCLIRYSTRFTHEIFAVLIALIFITEAVRSIVGYVQGAHAANLSHDVAFLSLLMALGTFALALRLSRFRKTRYLHPALREFLADFGPTLAVLMMLAFGLLFPEVKPESLDVPQSFGTTADRPWLVELSAVPLWVRLAAVVPAMFATVLIFLNQNIVGRLINNSDNKLQKGAAHHLDLLVVGGLVGVCSMFGLPWLVSSTVPSLNHLKSLATVEEVAAADGSRKERILHVRETRLTGLGIHLFIGCSLLLLPLLQAIPMAVLYGLFLFMGVVSLAGNQFFERLNLWLMESALYPQTHYLRRVPRRSIHLFTLLQLTCLVVLWIVKVSPAGILFPMFIALLVPVRLLASRFFAAAHLDALDAEELPEEEESEWA
ncbi:MAG: PTS sugar transporter subunit IIA, partial [Planctomycetaceae bacterium]